MVFSETGNSSSQEMRFQLEIVSSDAGHADPATIGAVARQSADMLEQRGYIVQPTYTATRGGPLYEIVVHIAQGIYDGKELLAALITLAAPIVAHLLEQRKQAGTAARSQAMLSEIVLEIDHTSVVVQPTDVETNEKLLARLLDVEPALPTHVTPHSRFKVKVLVPPQPARPRR